MKKQIVKKIILNGTILGFVMFFLITILPLQVNAAGTGLNWENPNANGKNPYTITTDAILNSQTLMQVVGCTGIVDMVSGAITDFLKDQTLSILKSAVTKAKETAQAKACDVAKAAILAPTGTLTGMTISVTLADGYKCPDTIKTSNTAQDATGTETNRILTATKKREECFNGLAYTLAKNQLTSMTRETLNWINNGFNGNPLYVQNMRSLTNSIERNVIETGIQVIANGAFPYGGNFNRTVIQSYNGGAMNGAEDFLLSLTSDLSAFLTDKDSYGLGNTNETLDAKARAINDNNRFANDFSVGGWDGWMALTQRDQNNPLGFTMLASQYLADRIGQQATETKDEVSQNNGFLSQKVCIKWWWWDDANTPTKGTQINNNNDVMGTAAIYEPVYKGNKSAKVPNFDKCMDWKVTTPGSIIKEKLTAYINSPERQLELADNINSALSGLFTKLIENFRSEGLFGLSQEKYSAIDGMIGYGINGTGVDGDIGSGYSSPTYSSGYSDDSFNLTRDLGNTYIHDEVRSLGTWDAKNNIATYHGSTTELNIDLGVYNEISSGYESPNYYFTVTTPGNRKLFNNGYNQWNYDDRVFWNGTSWQNWQCDKLTITRATNGNITSHTCAERGSPIDVRGIIQVQKDYVTAAKEILKRLPGIMPKLGELDYCIPGPNPNFEMNSSETGTAFNEFAGTLSGTWDPGSFFVRNSTTISISKKGNEKYDNYANIFKELPSLFDQTYPPKALAAALKGSIQATQPWKELHGAFLGESRNNAVEEKNQQAVDKVLKKIQDDISSFYTQYKEQIFNGRFGSMRSEFTEIENSSEQVVSTDYVPMIEDGYAATKDIVSKAEEFNTETQDYNDSIIIAQSNTAKLNIISSAVSKIVKDAQYRRDNNEEFQAKILAYFKQEQNDDTLTLAQAMVLYNQYKIDNTSCFDEEDLSYYNEGSTVPDSEEDAGRCADGLDNDLDGLIDMLDPDCKNIKTENDTQDDNYATLPSLTVTAIPGTISVGVTSTITWSSANTESCTNSHNSDIGTSGSFTVNPKSTTDYKITCIRERSSSDIFKIVTVYVNATDVGVGTKKPPGRNID